MSRADSYGQAIQTGSEAISEPRGFFYDRGQIHSSHRLFMPKVIAVDHFSLIEVKRRIAASKDSVQRFKNQRAAFLTAPTIIQLANYNCYDEYNFVSSVDLSERLIRDCVKQNYELFSDSSKYEFMSTSIYSCKHYESLRRLFSVTCFYLFEKEKAVSMNVLCLGSLHHAPRILQTRVFSTDSKLKSEMNKVAAYSDLH